MLRVVLQDGRAVPDPQRRSHGRGANLHPTERCVELAIRRKALGRALRAPGLVDLSPLREYVGRLESDRA